MSKIARMSSGPRIAFWAVLGLVAVLVAGEVDPTISGAVVAVVAVAWILDEIDYRRWRQTAGQMNEAASFTWEYADDVDSAGGAD